MTVREAKAIAAIMLLRAADTKDGVAKEDALAYTSGWENLAEEATKVLNKEFEKLLESPNEK